MQQARLGPVEDLAPIQLVSRAWQDDSVTPSVAAANVQAYKWCTLASSGTFTDSEKEMQADALANRTAVAAKMSPSQISSAQKLVREWTAH